MFTTLSCAGCGKGVRNWLGKKNKGLFCSAYCKRNAQLKAKNTKKKNTPRKKFTGFRASFYTSEVWKALRYQVLSKAKGQCVLCGRARRDGAVLHVDHIQPISIAPQRKLDPSNLQVLCAECNLGKSNTDSVDWR